MLRKFIAKVLLLSILGLFLLPSFSFFNTIRTQPANAADPAPPPPTPNPASYGIGCVSAACDQIVFMALATADDYGVRTSLVFTKSGTTGGGGDRWIYKLDATDASTTKIKTYLKFTEAGNTTEYDYKTIGLDVNTLTHKAYRLVAVKNPGLAILVKATSSEKYFDYLATGLTDLMTLLNVNGAMIGTLEPDNPSLPDFYKNWFSGETGIVLKIVLNLNDNTEAPRILYPPNPNAQASPGMSLERPLLTFRLKHVVGIRGENSVDKDDNWFYFVCETSPYYDLAIRVTMQKNQTENHKLVKYGDIRAWEDDMVIATTGATSDLDLQAYLDNIINKVYNGRTYLDISLEDWWESIKEDWLNAVPNVYAWGKLTGAACGIITTYDKNADPPYTKVEKVPIDKLSPGQVARCLNDGAGGWLEHWGVTFNQSSTGNPVYAKPVDFCSKNTVCANGGNDILCSMNQALCWVAKMFYDWFKLILGDAQKSLMSAIGFKESCN